MMPTTWFYVSALIISASFFKFNRFWSVRNFDLIGLILLTPGLIFLAMEDGTKGYAWLFIVGFLFCIRLVCDNLMHRRPLLEPNLTSGGLAFSCVCLLFFVVAALAANRGDNIDSARTVRLEQILTTRHIDKKIGINPFTQNVPLENWNDLPPGFRPFIVLTEKTNLALAPPEKVQQKIIQPHPVKASDKTEAAEVPASAVPPALIVSPAPPQSGTSDDDKEVQVIENRTDIVVTTQSVIAPQKAEEDAAEVPPPQSRPVSAMPVPPFAFVLLIVSHSALVLAFLFIGHSHFGSWRTGIACAALYLLHPYSNQMVGRLDHLVPAALILWSIALYRRPLFAGLGIGSAAALVWYPVLLVPLWCSFYWHRGRYRFFFGIAAAIGTFAALLSLSPLDLGTYHEQLLNMAGKASLIVFSEPDGFWQPADMYYRIPIFALYGAVCFGLFIYPAHKHLATLISCSALLMLGIQFWQLHQGGLYMAWYLPLLILTVFRPNLDDRSARNSVV
ncbi:MAG: DUF2029 domain-containing protein [Planctomycetaceae bacterium]|jgi:hypothetical protein|nr:DUF2029 domain-containing protein [Planctomycetaceae bacterium]